MPKTPEWTPPTLSRAELVAILKQIDTSTMIGFRDQPLLLNLLDTRCRLRELTEAKLEAPDLEIGPLKVVGKGCRERILPPGQTSGQTDGQMAG